MTFAALFTLTRPSQRRGLRPVRTSRAAWRPLPTSSAGRYRAATMPRSVPSRSVSRSWGSLISALRSCWRSTVSSPLARRSRGPSRLLSWWRTSPGPWPTRSWSGRSRRYRSPRSMQTMTDTPIGMEPRLHRQVWRSDGTRSRNAPCYHVRPDLTAGAIWHRVAGACASAQRGKDPTVAKSTP